MRSHEEIDSIYKNKGFSLFMGLWRPCMGFKTQSEWKPLKQKQWIECAVFLIIGGASFLGYVTIKNKPPPHARRRIIDLSQTAANRLGIGKLGVVPVVIRVVPKKNQALPHSAPPASGGH